MVSISTSIITSGVCISFRIRFFNIPSYTREEKEIDTKLKNFIINTLRRASFRWKPRGEAKKKYKVKVGEYKTGRAKYGYKCAMCEGVFKSGEVKMDHIEPAVPLTGWAGLDVFAERMFCDEDGFQCLCPGCHDEKTGIEREERKRHRELQKEKK